MKYQALFSLKNKEEVIMNVFCCSHDWCFKDNRMDLCTLIWSYFGGEKHWSCIGIHVKESLSF